MEDKIDTMRDDCASKIDLLRSDLVGRIDMIEEEQAKAVVSINSLSEKYAAIEGDVMKLCQFSTAVNTQLSDVRKQTEALTKEQTEFERAINFVGNQYEDMRKDLADFMESKSQVVDNVSNIDSATAAHHFHLHRLEGELNKFQQAKLWLNLVITGFSKIVSPVDTFWGLMTTLKAEISPNDVSSINILNAKATNSRKSAFKSLTLLVCFSNNKAKIEVIKKKRAAGVVFTDPSGNDRRRQIYIRDHLTKYGLFLFDKAQEFKTKFGFKFLWTRDGRILLCKEQKTKTFEINSLNDLNKLHRKHTNPATRSSSKVPDANVSSAPPNGPTTDQTASSTSVLQENVQGPLP